MILIYLLPFSAALNGISLPIGNWHVRLEQILSCGLLAILLIRFLVTNKLYLDTTSKFIMIVLSLHILSSLISAPNIKFSILQTFSLMSVWFIYIILINFLNNKAKIIKFIIIYLISGFLAILYGIIIFIISFYIGYNIPGANVFAESGIAAFGIQGTLIEPNVFGSFCLTFLIICLTMVYYINKDKLHYRSLLLVFLLLAISGLILSFTRGAWLAGIVGIVLIVILNRITLQRVAIKYGYQLLLGGVLIIVAFILAKDYLPDSFLTYKIDNFIAADEFNAEKRFDVWKEAIDNIRKKPIFGNGTYSFASINNFEDVCGPLENAWIGNLFVTILHDSGIIGLLTFLILCINIFISGIKAINNLKHYDIIMTYITLSLVVSFVSLLVSFVFTTAISAAYPWITIGLMGSISRYARNHTIMDTN